MRALMLATQAWGATGGIQRFNREFAGALTRADVDVDVLVRDGTSERLGARLAQTAARGRIGFLQRAAAKLKSPDVAGLVCGHLNFLQPATWLAARAQCPLWLIAHGIEAWQPPRRAKRAASARCALITAVSRYTRRRLLSWSAVDPARVRVLNNTVDPSFAGVDGAPFREHLGLDQETPLVLTVTRLDASEGYKGVAPLLARLPELWQHMPSAHYAIIGDGDDRQRLMSVAAEIDPQRIHFCGRIDDALLPAAYAAADCFVLPSSGEGFGIVYLEAALAGCPVVALDRAGVRDALVDGALGRLAQWPEMVDAIIAAMAGDAPEPLMIEQRFGRDTFDREVAAHWRQLTQAANGV